MLAGEFFPNEPSSNLPPQPPVAFTPADWSEGRYYGDYNPEGLVGSGDDGMDWFTEPPYGVDSNYSDMIPGDDGPFTEFGDFGHGRQFQHERGSEMTDRDFN